MVVGIKVDSQNIQTGLTKHCNSSYFSMVAKDEKGNSVKVLGLTITDLTGLRRFLRSIKLSILKCVMKEILNLAKGILLIRIIHLH